MWARAIGLSHGLLNLGFGETFGFKKLDALGQWRSLSLDETLRRVGERQIRTVNNKTLGSVRNATALRMSSCLSVMSVR